MPRPLKRPVRVVVHLSDAGAAYVDGRRGKRSRAEFIRAMMRAARPRVDAGVPLVFDDDDEKGTT